VIVDLGTVKLSCRTWGDPANSADRAVVLLHGLGSDSATWDQVAPMLAEDHYLVAPDLRGHGASDRPGEYSFELFGQDTLDLVAALDLAPAVLVGHSLGAVAAYLAGQQNPGAVAGLVLEEPPPPIPLGRPLPVPPTEPPAHDFAVNQAIVPQLNAPDPRWGTRLAELTMPALVLAGGPESHFPQAEYRIMADRLPAGRLLTVPVGHEIHTKAAVEFVAVVREFLDQI
jgi:3-oxoadipate enol-lactonase